MRILVTGAGGFVGTALIAKLRVRYPNAELVLFDTQLPAGATGRVVVGDLADREVRASAVVDGVDMLFHLAAVPGGTAEGNPVLARRVNLDATLDLLEDAARVGRRPRIVYTSTIAVIGDPMPATVDDATPLAPRMIYGAHKLMVEIALADMHRRGAVDAVGLRLPGIVARPGGSTAMKSAFMSNLFHDLLAGRDFVSPVSPAATLWLMSLEQVADNLLHAAEVASDALPAARTVTLPAIRCRMDELIDAVRAATSYPGGASYRPDDALERAFGTHPPLRADAALAAGFADDSSLDGLVHRVVTQLRTVA